MCLPNTSEDLSSSLNLGNTSRLEMVNKCGAALLNLSFNGNDFEFDDDADDLPPIVCIACQPGFSTH